MGVFNYSAATLTEPVFKAIKELGGSAQNSEITEKVIEYLNLSEEEIDDLHTESQTKLDYRLAWARTSLKNAEYIANSSRGVWVLTEKGQKTEFVTAANVNKERFKKSTTSIKPDSNESLNETVENENLDEERLSWDIEVLNILKSITPKQFENLCKRLLRELGFEKVVVTGASRDGGIDGYGIVKLNKIISYNIAFQAKRYDKSVGSPDIRNFRGSLDGKAQQGVFITTGTFTQDAKDEANRDGVISIDLIDGHKLVEFLKEFELGLKTEFVEKVNIDKEWFTNLEK